MVISKYDAMLKLVAEMTIDDSIRKRHKELLQQKIEESLDNFDSKSFYTYTNELKEIIHNEVK